MFCPSCNGEIEDSAAWICPHCDHILDPSIFGEDILAESPPIREERTRIVAWSPPSERSSNGEEAIPDAVIVGSDASESLGVSVVAGAGQSGDGRTSTFLFYTASSTSRCLRPDAIPRIVRPDSREPRTPYEDFILSCIDGERSVRVIHRLCGLASQEVVVTLLTLLDKRIIEMRVPNDGEEAVVRSEPSGRPRRASSRQRSGSNPPSRLTSEPLTRKRLTGKDKSTLPVEARPRHSDIPEDFDELPSVSDVQEIPARKRMMEFEEDAPSIELSGSIDFSSALRSGTHDFDRGAPQKPLVESSALSDVWARSSIDADELVEDALDEDAPGIVEPQPLEDDAGEMVTDAALKPKPLPFAPFEPSSLTPLPLPSDALLPAYSPLEEWDPPEDEAPVVPSVPSVPVVPDLPVVPVAPAPLDPSFLVEIPHSSVSVRPASISSSGGIVITPSKAPAKNFDTGSSRPRSTFEARSEPKPSEVGRSESLRAAGANPAPSNSGSTSALSAAAAFSLPRSDLSPVDSVRMLKGQRLFEQALKDRDEGNVISARMNIKLAMTFDPANEAYQRAFDEISKNPDAIAKAGMSLAKSKARELYDKATEAENMGDVDRAIECLEAAIRESKQSAFYNRLGVILAMKKQEYTRAQELVEKAIELAPFNETYQRNLHKILSTAATAASKPAEPNKGKKGIIGLLGKLKMES